MQREVRLFAPLQLPITAQLIYTATNVRTIITSLAGCNTTGGARSVTIYLGAADPTHTIVYHKSVGAGLTVEFFDRAKILNEGDTLMAFCDLAAAVSFMGFGVEIDV